MTAPRPSQGPQGAPGTEATPGVGSAPSDAAEADTALRDRLVLALARTVYRDDDPPPHIVRICEPWADEIARDLDAWAAEQTQRAEQAEQAEQDAKRERALRRSGDTTSDGFLIRLHEAEAAVQRVREFAEDMRTWCSPYGVAADYAKRLLAALGRPEGT